MKERGNEGAHEGASSAARSGKPAAQMASGEISGRAGEVLGQLEASLDELLSLSPAMLSDGELREANRQLFRLDQVLASARYAHVRELDARPDVIPGLNRGSRYRSFARHVLRQSETDAKADLAAAKMLDPALTASRGGMPRLAAALAEGSVSRAHVRRVVQTMEKIPKRFLPIPAGDLAREFKPADAGKCGGDLIDEFLTEASREHAPTDSAKLAERLLRTLAPDQADRYDQEAHLRRSLSFTKDSTGMVVGRFQLDEANGAIFTAVLSSLAAPRATREEQTEDGSTIRIVDHRTPGMRLADALGEACRRAASTVFDSLDQSHQSHQSHQPGTPGTPVPDGDDPSSPGLIIPGQRRDSPTGGLYLPGSDSAHGSDRLVIPRQHFRGKDGTGGVAREASEHGADVPRHRGLRPVTPRIMLLATVEQVRAASGSASACTCGRRSGAPDPGQAEDLLSGPVTRAHLATTLCDAIVQRVLQAPNGALLNLGRSQRLFSPAQRAGLAARDRGCVIPGCTMPAAWCDAHHPDEWADGGPTDVDNGALACPSHHHQIHAGLWTVVMIDGVPWTRPPAWIDPDQRLLRNTFWDHEAAAADLGHRLRAAITTTGATLTPPTDQGPIPPEWRVRRHD